ncbi:MAG: ABC transporter ATP-binding protein/permease [Firmicutes bacterium]|nr:ABC transporter ATP-binding protein/permease [Bacillota bacterium]
MMKKLRTKPLFRVLSMFSDLKWRIVLFISLGAIGIVLFSFMPFFTRNIFDSLEESILYGTNPELSFIYRQLFLFGLLALFNEVFQVVGLLTIIKYEAEIKEKNIINAKRKLDLVPISFLENYAEGDLARRVSALAGQIVRNLLSIIYRVVRTVFFFVTTAIIMFSINWILALVVIISVPLCLFGIRFISKRTQKLFNNNNATLNEVSAYVDQKMSLHQFNKVHGIGGAEEEYEVYNKREVKSRVGEEMAMELNTIFIFFIQNFMALLVTVVFGLLFLNGAVAIGALPAFIIFSSRFLANSVIVSETTNILQALNARAPMVFEILDYPDTLTEKEHIDIDKIKDIEFKNVSLESHGELVLKDINFTIPKGSSVAIVGPTGGGKTKIVDVLSKMELVTSGEVIINDVNLEEVNRDSYYKLIGIAFERPFIFKGTIAENVLYGVRRAMPEQVMNVTRKLGSHDFIEKLPQRYETELTPETHLLTTSQKQAINIARTVLKANDLVIFNGAYSSVDTVTEKETFEKIMSTNAKQTKIFVTNRLSSVEKCDHIILMEGGEAVEQGTHKELMRKRGRYYEAFING